MYIDNLMFLLFNYTIFAKNKTGNDFIEIDMKTCLLALLCWFALLPTLAVKGENFTQEKKTLKIGAILALTGYAAIHGNNIKHGLELAKADLESQGWHVDLAVEDDNTQSAKTISAIYSLNSRGYKLFIGPTWSFQVDSAIPVLEKQNAISYCPSTSSTVVGQKSKNVFHGVSFGVRQLKPLVAWLTGLSAKRIAILYADCAWGRVHNELYRKAAEETGSEIVAEDKFSYGEEDAVLPIIVTKLKGKAPDVILTTGSAQSSALIVKKVKELKMDTKVMSTDDMQDAILQGLINVSDKTNPKVYALLAQVTKEFRDKYNKTFNTQAGVYSDSAYDGLMLLAKAIEETDGSVGQIRDYLHERLIYNGYSGRFDFDESGDTQKSFFAVEALNLN